MDSWVFLSDEGGLEEEFRASESLVLDGDDVTIGELEGLIVGSGVLVLS